MNIRKLWSEITGGKRCRGARSIHGRRVRCDFRFFYGGGNHVLHSNTARMAWWSDGPGDGEWGRLVEIPYVKTYPPGADGPVWEIHPESEWAR